MRASGLSASAASRVSFRRRTSQRSSGEPGQWMLTYGVTVEIEGQDKPALIAQWLTLQIVS